MTAVLIGLLAGAMLLIAVAVVPFWRSLPPDEFRRWFFAHSRRIGRMMIPLGGSTALLSIAALVASGSGARRWSFGAALAATAIGAITLLVNEPANERFAATNDLTDTETVALLQRWVTFHWIRVALGIAGLACAVEAVSR